VAWGLPYFIGRVYFMDVRGLKELAVGIFIGGLVYVPLCLYEIRMSPQLHNMVYGYHQHSFVQSFRWGNWRPMVFMGHGLMVGMWMTAASLTGLWFWMTGGLRRVFGMPLAAVVPPLIATTVVLRSTGALALLVLGTAMLAMIKLKPTRAPIIGVAGLTVLYVVVRAAGLWGGHELADAASFLFGADRAESLVFRLENEELLVAQAARRPLVGWGRFRDEDNDGQHTVVSDGMWIIVFGNNGVVGLASFMAVVLLPALLLGARADPQYWTHPDLAGAVCCACLLTLWMVDNLFNAMPNPVFLLVAGGLAGLRLTPMTRRMTRPPRMGPASLA